HLAHRRHAAEVAAALGFDDDGFGYAEWVVRGVPGEIALAGSLEADLDGLGGGDHASVYAPISAYFSARRRTSFSGRIFLSSPRCRMSDSRTASPVWSGSWCAPPAGSGMISSMSLRRSRSSAVRSEERRVGKERIMGSRAAR